MKALLMIKCRRSYGLANIIVEVRAHYHGFGLKKSFTPAC